jgi:hypothetical protein
VVVGDDFTVRGGSADASIADKPLMADGCAARCRLPIDALAHRQAALRRAGA